MLFENRCTLLQLTGRKQLEHLAMHRDQALRIVVAAIDEDHSHTQFANDLLIENFQALVAVKTNKKTVELEIMVNSADPIFGLHAGFVLLDRDAKLTQQFGIRLAGGQHSRNFEHAAKVIDLLDIAQRELRDDDAAVKIAVEQSFERQDAQRLAHGIAGDSKGRSQRQFLKGSAGTKFAIEDALAQDRGHLIRDAKAVNLGTLHASFAGEGESGRHCVAEWSLCQVVKS